MQRISDNWDFVPQWVGVSSREQWPHHCYFSGSISTSVPRHQQSVGQQDSALSGDHGLNGPSVGNRGGFSFDWPHIDRTNDQRVAKNALHPSTLLHLAVTPSQFSFNADINQDFPHTYIQGSAEPSFDVPLVIAHVASHAAGNDGCGAYIRTIGKAGSAKAEFATTQTEPVDVSFAIMEEEMPN